jgi:hypothetical protein
MTNASPANGGAGKYRALAAPVSYRENSIPSGRDDATLKAGLFEHLVVGSGMPDACRDRPIHPSAWKGNSTNFAITEF